MGREILRPGEWALRPENAAQAAHVPLEEREGQARDNQQQYQLRYTGAPAAQAFEVGDWVYALNHRLSNKVERYNADLAPKRTGPHQVVGAASADVFWVQKHDRAHKLHKTQLVPAPPPQGARAATGPAGNKAEIGDQRENREAEDIDEAHNTDALTVEGVRNQQTAEQARQTIEEDEEEAQAAEQVCPADPERAGSVGAIAQAEPHNTALHTGHRVAPISVKVEHSRFPLPTALLPPAAQESMELWADTRNSEAWDSVDGLPRNARGRFDLRVRPQRVYRDARPYAPRRRRT